MKSNYTIKDNIKQVVGIDEVGRGAWAGPVVAAAVLLDHKTSHSKDYPCKSGESGELVKRGERGEGVGWGDSKSLTRHQREAADRQIRSMALGIGLGWVSAGEVDRLGLTAAVAMAMEQALAKIDLGYNLIIIDGNYNFLSHNTLAVTQVKADQTVPAVSAASIVAKVARDKYMRDIATKFPQYFFEKHVGYGTKTHLEALKKHGMCELHRLSFKPVSQLVGR